ncbi:MULTISPECIES: hypothetical protein [Methylosinus]|uniref:Yip1 domain-containing protein n=1 Tax=Methylosinus trichosporium (strain ATCC 35070 / NCIMB 11131 / UNIQEM 75 / OB3b) TaxID=595536 RepID=A0A2D2D2V8_METT3|nr:MULTISPECIES: hypothetical protein [Methylosinus]ATQ69340.1 hypothetical protein CQW49_16710 [Methylosinus trichosporium OB3b]OBS52523.1 hypothetical protein A8B73_10795 [Methylosinus sp. 3S-1]
MSISLPTLSLPTTPRAIIDIMRLEAGPTALPASRTFLFVSLAAYAVGEMAQQLVAKDLLPSIAYGLGSTVLLVAFTFVALLLVGARDRLPQTLAALGSVGAVVAVVVIVLHLMVGVVLPPPLPTEKLVNFLLFPLVLWKVTLFMWIFRHASLRFIPSIAVSVLYVGFTVFVLAPLLARVFLFL